eukprot:scaffold73410_cov35-Tisochrysis_lutea.AAC.3
MGVDRLRRTFSATERGAGLNAADCEASRPRRRPQAALAIAPRSAGGSPWPSLNTTYYLLVELYSTLMRY